jgi:nucleobase:cation symporter-1, NCS1 family
MTERLEEGPSMAGQTIEKGAPDAIYGAKIAEVEPFGIEPIAATERHGTPRDLFGLWFSANAETATWSVGILTIALYGTSLRGAIFGIVVGNLVGYALLGVLSTFGPRWGLPQMMQSRLSFGAYGNVVPAALAFLAGIGWFAVDCVLGAYALGTLVHLSYLPALGIMLLIQVIIVIYGYNMIHLFERVTAIALAGGFLVLGAVTLQRANWAAPFNPHTPAAQGGESAGIILAIALAFSYVIGWVPSASDYSRYLPQSTNPRAIRRWVFLGGFIPCTILEIMGAAAVTALPSYDLAALQPTAAVTLLLGTGIAGSLGLITIMLGTLTANCINLYSGSLSALAVWPRVRLGRWQVAVVIAVVGGALAMLGAHPERTAQLYTDFLLLLAAWASPWAGVVLVQWWLNRRKRPDPTAAFALKPPLRIGVFAWIIGLLASIPFLDQAWFVGWIARANPWIGDVSYEVGIVAAAATMLLALRLQRA